ncbi:MAG: ArnT family glycosyltransferase [Chloroflexia bacterium]
MGGAGRAERLWLAGILLLAVAARYVGLSQGSPHDYHWDENIYFHEAFYGLANGLRRESTVSANLPYLLMPGLLLQWLAGVLSGQVGSFGDVVRSYISSPEPFVLVGRAAWAASGVLSVAMVYRVARRISGPAFGLLSAFFLSVAFLHVEQSHFIKNDVPAGLFLLFALDRAFSIQERGARRDYLWAGFWIGMASATKYYCAAVAPIILVAHLMRPTSEAQPTVRGWTPLLPSALGAVAGFVLTTPVLLIDPRNLLDSLAWELGARFGSIPTGDTPQWLFYINEHLANGLGRPLLVLALGGMIFVALRRTPKGLLLAATAVLFFVAVNLRPNNFARYIVPCVPFLCITAAIALRTIIGALLGPVPARVRLLGTALLVVGGVLVAAPSWLNVIRYDYFALGTDTRNAAQAWFEKSVPAGASVLVEGSVPGGSFERTSNLGPQIWPNVQELEASGAIGPSERFFWEQLLPVVSASPAYSLTLVGSVERQVRESGGYRVNSPVASISEYGSPDYVMLLSWRSADLRAGSPSPLWRSIQEEYSLVQIFACRPCFPEDYYAWRTDYPTLESIAVFGGAQPVGGPEVRVFERNTTHFPVRGLPAAP